MVTKEKYEKLKQSICTICKDKDYQWREMTKDQKVIELKDASISIRKYVPWIIFLLFVKNFLCLKDSFENNNDQCWWLFNTQRSHFIAIVTWRKGVELHNNKISNNIKIKLVLIQAIFLKVILNIIYDPATKKTIQRPTIKETKRGLKE